jgi:hypothetical protein
MALNPFFLQGSANEQFLVQDLVNEQLKMYGLDVYYIPRKILGTETLSREVTLSKLDDNFIIEAYLNNYEGYGANSEILSKFGVQLKSEISLTISEERFQLFIEPFLKDLQKADPTEIIVTDRPREGDVIYFPLGERLYEIKNVEHEKPFFQLGKNYIYELSCELLELEDEIIETSVDEIDSAVENYGYITTLTFVSSGINATATATIANEGSVRQITLTNDGYDYTSAPTVSISTAPVGGTNATAVAIKTDSSVYEVLITNAGAGYTETPTVTFSGAGGAGAAATATLGDGSVQYISIANTGANYVVTPTITLTGPSTISAGSSATAQAVIGAGGSVTDIRLSNAGFGYTSAPVVAISSAPSAGIGTFQVNEIVTGSLSGTTARVKKYDQDDNTLNVYINSGNFTAGETITGSDSGASYTLLSYNSDPGIEIEYSQNEEIEELADDILDFTESNPFGTY